MTLAYVGEGEEGRVRKTNLRIFRGALSLSLLLGNDAPGQGPEQGLREKGCWTKSPLFTNE